jgi:type I restriction enzyme S subunit
MSEWKECRIADAPFEIIDGDRGTNYPKQDEFNQNGYCLFLNAKNVTTDGFAFDECYFISKEKDEILRKGKLRRNDIVLTTRGTVGNIGFFNERIPYEHIRINSGMVIIRPDLEGILPEYTHQLFKYLKGDFDVFATGSAQPQLPIRDLKEISFSLPPLPEQRAIAGVLSSLDDKIDLLHRQNKTLEGMAEALWRKMFVEERNNSATACLNDYVSCINGVSYKSSELNPSKTALVTLKSFNRYGGFSVDGFKEFTGKHKVQQIVLEGDLVVAHTDITQEAEVLGNPALIISSPIYDTLVISMDLVKVVPKMDWVSKEFLYFLMRSRKFKHHCLGCANGTTVLHLNKEAIPTFEFSIPDKSKEIEFTELAKDLIRQVFVKHRQIRTLSRLRDTLLPKLMSGEVRVKL